jgi:hypothetical protein
MCSIKGCSKSVQARGWCSTHYKRWEKFGDPERINVHVRGECSLENCSEPHLAKGYCMTHYYKWLRSGDPNFVKPKAPPKRVYDKSGYVELTNMQGHPNARKNGRIFEHVAVMSERLGRPLEAHENVHHKNGQRDDNSIENLELWSRSQPYGQRVEDKTAWAIEWLKQYSPESLKEV